MEDFSDINGEGTVLRAAQLKMLDILLEIDRVCKKNNLTYWIDFGTLLGAVRHKGFIPWDDDIDISMTTESYNRFKEIAPTELGPDFILQTEKTQPFARQGRGMFKVRLKNTMYLMQHDSVRQPYSKGLFVDVFDSVPYPTMNRRFFKFLVRRISKSYGFMMYNQELNFGNIIRYFVFPVEFAFFYSVWKFCCLFHKKDRELTPMTRLLYGYPSLKTDIHPLGEIEFEGHIFPCPNNPDARLRDMWGDYMTLPSADKRRIHTKFICLDTTKCHIDADQ